MTTKKAFWVDYFFAKLVPDLVHLSALMDLAGIMAGEEPGVEVASILLAWTSIATVASERGKNALAWILQTEISYTFLASHFIKQNRYWKKPKTSNAWADHRLLENHQLERAQTVTFKDDGKTQPFCTTFHVVWSLVNICSPEQHWGQLLAGTSISRGPYRSTQC